MDRGLESVLRDCTQGSDEGRLDFPEVLRRLSAAGIERYHADLARAERTYYLPDGRSHRLPAQAGGAAAAAFSATGVEAAIRAVQARSLSYREFCDRIGAAGCVGYLVSIPGRRAVYYGRTGETHVEPFPALHS
ncbi:DUF1398 domain-containing protein [Roseomonas sp. OT10]|uniref:DUF1398 domain-containing protein n=1 Tax=Roseomonas cutis TaxID=2897332 RepID=UPI001E360C20|nr:DUF1398 domain-containing protein [Roseomonas sp. OT10]UFN50843.1 DUF1398 domain-containing protein [Roseomonas sp. OT10]